MVGHFEIGGWNREKASINHETVEISTLWARWHVDIYFRVQTSNHLCNFNDIAVRMIHV